MWYENVDLGKLLQRFKGPVRQPYVSLSTYKCIFLSAGLSCPHLFPRTRSLVHTSHGVVQFFVVLVTISGAYYAMDANIRSDLNSIVGPTFMTAVLAYYTGKMITGVFGMSITTILQCFVADEELFPPSQQFADNDLKSWVDKHGAPMEVDSHPQSRSGANQYAFS